jgi:hypothetical protein
MLKGHPRSPIPADKWRTKVEKKTDGNYLRIPLIVEASKSKNVECNVGISEQISS